MKLPKPRVLLERLYHHRQKHQRRSLAFRVAAGLAGVLITLTGIGMLILPGPALLVIPLGLFILALEFTWAEKLLERAVLYVEDLAKQSSAMSPGERQITGVLAVIFALALGAAVLFLDLPGPL